MVDCKEDSMDQEGSAMTDSDVNAVAGAGAGAGGEGAGDGPITREDVTSLTLEGLETGEGMVWPDTVQIVTPTFSAQAISMYEFPAETVLELNYSRPEDRFAMMREMFATSLVVAKAASDLDILSYQETADAMDQWQNLSRKAGISHMREQADEEMAAELAERTARQAAELLGKDVKVTRKMIDGVEVVEIDGGSINSDAAKGLMERLRDAGLLGKRKPESEPDAE